MLAGQEAYETLHGWWWWWESQSRARRTWAFMLHPVLQGISLCYENPGLPKSASLESKWKQSVGRFMQ